jgi:hypothetical protein
VGDGGGIAQAREEEERARGCGFGQADMGRMINDIIENEEIRDANPDGTLGMSLRRILQSPAGQRAVQDGNYEGLKGQLQAVMPALSPRSRGVGKTEARTRDSGSSDSCDKY